ncbi:molybdopterin molybdotransferase MoeA [Aliiglaciecola sp. LCG003]|nr:gephyrin-like molybdotransferase Glp [Aliiglaciecola sp. LCG003]WJG11290.1 molybdopterin molybdotransferase MoeA [Aliiglaciecola sp. LCG003]
MNEHCDSPDLLPIQHALAKMLKQAPALTDFETIDLLEGLNRVLASTIVSEVNVPPSDNSAMDGYAFFCDVTLAADTELCVQGQALAGNPFESEVKPGHCVLITTGAILPAGTNTVVMQENVSTEAQKIILNTTVRPGNSVRSRGEDIRKGDKVITKGTKLTPAHLALIASLGLAKIEVTPKLKVAIIATGDELVEAGDSLNDGQIYESNRFALHGLLQQLNVDIIHYGIIADEPDALKKSLLDAANNADVVITCGGVSVGKADYVKQVLQQIGEINFWKVAIKPGKPFAFGKIQDAIFCGLPGNPVSSYVTFEKLVAPVLNNLMGCKPPRSIPQVALCAEKINKRVGRADFQRGIAYQDNNGILWVKLNGKQGSGIMTSVANANCYILLEQEQGNVPQGAEVKIELF